MYTPKFFKGAGSLSSQRKIYMYKFFEEIPIFNYSHLNNYLLAKS